MPPISLLMLKFHSQNLRSWFNNKTQSGKNKIRPDLLTFKEPKKNKLRHDFQAYSKLYYKDHIKDATDTAWKEALEAYEQGKLEKQPWYLTILQDVTKAHFEEEPQKVQDHVKAYRKSYNEAIDNGKKLGIDESEDEGKEGTEDDEESEELEEKCCIAKAGQYLVQVTFKVLYADEETYLQ